MNKIKKTILTLVALLAVTTGAWADEPKVYDSGEVEVFSLELGDILMPGVTLTNKGDKEIDAYLNYNRYSIEGVIQQMGSRISSIPFSIGENGLITAQLAGDATYNCMPITAEGEAGNAWVVTYIDEPSYRPGYKEINIGGIKVGSSGTAVDITWTAATKIATIAEMPAGNVTVSVEYYDEAAFAVDKTGETPVTLAPKANNSAKANTDDPLVEGGTVANIVEAMEVLDAKQGKLLYHVSTTELTNDQLEALNPEDDWSETVPTANGFTFETATNVYVYYYIQGADNVQGNAADSKFTFSDTEIQMLTVNVQPAPKYNAEFDLTNAPEEDKVEGVWTTNIPEGGVMKGTNVIVTYSGSKKVIGVKAEKKGALLTLSVCGETIYYAEGETWAEAIQNHPTENQGWEIYDGDVSHDNLGFLLQNDDWVPGTAKIDPNASYDNSGV